MSCREQGQGFQGRSGWRTRGGAGGRCRGRGSVGARARFWGAERPGPDRTPRPGGPLVGWASPATPERPPRAGESSSSTNARFGPASLRAAKPGGKRDRPGPGLRAPPAGLGLRERAGDEGGAQTIRTRTTTGVADRRPPEGSRRQSGPNQRVRPWSTGFGPDCRIRVLRRGRRVRPWSTGPRRVNRCFRTEGFRRGGPDSGSSRDIQTGIGRTRPQRKRRAAVTSRQPGRIVRRAGQQTKPLATPPRSRCPPFPTPS